MDKLRTINPEQAGALFRTLLQFLGGIGVTYGLMTEGQMTAIISGLVTVLVTVWGIWSRSDTNLIKSAAAVPAVHTITAEREVASSVPAENVIPPAGSIR